MVKLRRLKIERFRNVEPCNLTFSDGLNVVLGQNGAGKTTLLNFVSKVLRTNLADTSDPFAIEIELVFPGGSLSGRISTREPEPLPQEFERLDDAQNFFDPGGDSGRAMAPDFDIVFINESSGERVLLRGKKNVFECERKTSDGPTVGPMPAEAFLTPLGLLGYLAAVGFQFSGEDSAAVLLSVVAASVHTLRFDEGLDIYRAVVAKVDDYVTVGPDVRPSAWFSRQNDGIGRSLRSTAGLIGGSLSAALEAHPMSVDLVQLSLTHDKLRFLTDVVRLLDLQFAEARFELLEKKTTSKGYALHFGNLRFWFTRKDGSIFQDHQLSYGQKRLLTFLYYLDANPSFVIADELVNGMHHRWIEESVRAIGERQAFLTSQNPLLLDYLTFESIEQVKSSFVVCRTELHEGRERMIWRNFTDDEADMFFRAYRVGIEHVGEILRTRGLW